MLFGIGIPEQRTLADPALYSQQDQPAGLHRGRHPVASAIPSSQTATVRGEGQMALTSQFRTRRAQPAGSANTKTTEHWALTRRDDPTDAGGATQRCSICNHMFR